MSIQTELTRITNAKSAIKTAVEGKGVTVPDGTLLDGMAALIDSIEAGGGGAMTSGKFTPTADISSVYTITHNLGVVPNLFVLFLNDRSSGVTKSLIYAIFYNGLNPVFGVSNTGTQGYTIYQFQDWIKDITSTANSDGPLRGATSTTIEVHPEAKSVVLKARKEYVWVACA